MGEWPEGEGQIENFSERQPAVLIPLPVEKQTADLQRRAVCMMQEPPADTERTWIPIWRKVVCFLVRQRLWWFF